MTDTSCWIRFPSDRSLQKKIKEGQFSTDGDAHHFTTCDFPLAHINGYWTTALLTWCKAQKVEYCWVDDLTLVAKVKRDQIISFIDHIYGSDLAYNDPKAMLTWKGEAYLANRLTNLKAFVYQNLSHRLWYELVADEF